MKSKPASKTLIALCFCVLPFLALADGSILHHIDEDTESSHLVSEFLRSHRVKRYSIVNVDVKTLRETITKFEQPGTVEACCILNFQVFRDVEVALHTYGVDAEHLEPWHWTGVDSINGDEAVIASLTIEFGDRVTGSFNGSGGRIRIEPLDRRGTHIIWETEPFEKVID